MTVTGGTSRFVSKKLRKLRWKPRTDSLQMSSDIFAIGTWDDESNEVSLWKTTNTGESQHLETVQLKGDVTGLTWLTAEMLAASTSAGTASVFKLEQHKQLSGGNRQDWTDLHGHGGTTCLAAHGETIATAGEDGKINVMNVRQRNPVKVFDKADSCSINDITFSRSTDILTANMRGQMKLFDLRSNKQEASSTYLLSNDQVSITCLAKHPTQGHIVISGGENGVLAVWDLRQGRHPTTILAAHSAPISEVKFHPDQPDHVFTCSQNGELWHWNGSSIRTYTAGAAPSTAASPWLSSEAVKHKVETTSLATQQPLPINSVDVLGHAVLYGGDNEAFYILNNIVM
uniref:Nucleoporin Nup43 n=1 Tax=Acartia pacifica TaxID=335913 RepID=A0A0U2LFD5_ACAPC|nr:nucleoporin Nup43 [Acartia pacifica]